MNKKSLVVTSVAVALLLEMPFLVNAQTIPVKPATLGVEEQAVAGSTYCSHDSPEMIAAALKGIPAPPPGLVLESWESIAQNYQDAEWFRDAKFGIMMHWGIYPVPAHGSEWYVLHVKSPAEKPCDCAYVLKITGLKLK